jgi:DNA-binding MarR family transcriptional regulator
VVTDSADRPDDLPGKVVAALDRIARGVRAHRQVIATRAGVTPLQADLVRTLAEGTPPEAQPSSLAVEVGVSQPTASDALSALVRKGLLRRTTTPGDRRSSTYTLTVHGAELADELRRADAVLHEAVTVLSAADQEHALGTLLELISSLLSSGVLRVARTCPTCRFFEPGPTARCGLLQAPLALSDYRVNCPEHDLIA